MTNQNRNYPTRMHEVLGVETGERFRLKNSSDKTPDPETGLVPCCWCGGKAGFHYSVMMRDNDCYVECGVCGEHSKVLLSEDDARDMWNYFMGYRGYPESRRRGGGMMDWISVKDRLPDAADGIIGATGEPEVLTICEFAHGWFPEVIRVSNVREMPKYYRYWMPLPEPPGGLIEEE